MASLSFNGKNYEVLRLLGKGKGGYSYLVTDGKTNYVLKQIHHEICSYYTFGDKVEAEMEAYRKLSGIGIPMPVLLDLDRPEERILKEFIDGETIYVLLLKNEMKESYLEQMESMSKRLQRCNTNIDYFPTNFVVRGEMMYYVDYECNDYMAKWSFENWGISYWSRTPLFLEYASAHKSE